MSQGPTMPPAWLLVLAERHDVYLIWGSFGPGPCRASVEQPRFRHICLPQTLWQLGHGRVQGNVTYTSGRNRLYRHALAWEAERGRRFLFFVFADESGEFVFNNCSPDACGDASLRPHKHELPGSFFHRLLYIDQPAVASAINSIDDSECLPSSQMRKCTSSLDHKVVAFHWSAHPLLLPYEEGFVKISIHASQCIVNELVEAAFVGYAVHYRMFSWAARSAFPAARPHYIRNLQPCLPRTLHDGTYGDSAVVAWLRPQLQACASLRLGASYWLQAGCEEGAGTSPDDKCLLGGFACLPWASGSTCNQPVVPGPGALRPPRRSGAYEAFRMSKAWGLGDVSAVGVECAAGDGMRCSMDELCALGKHNFEALRASRALLTPHPLALAWAAVEGYLTQMASKPRSQPAPECDICTCLLLGAVADTNVVARAYRNRTRGRGFWNWWWCLTAFLQKSFMLMLSAGWIGPFDMLRHFTERLLPSGARPGSHIEWDPPWLAAASNSTASWRVGLSQAEFACPVDRAIQHVLDALDDASWRQGHIFAAQQQLASCSIFVTGAQPNMSFFWALVALVGRRGLHAEPPDAPPCGDRNRRVDRMRRTIYQRSTMSSASFLTKTG